MPFFFGTALSIYAVWIDSFAWYYVLSLGTYKAVSHIGYGGDTLGKKLLRRSLWAVIYSMASLVFVFHSGAWLIWLTQLGFALAISILFGVWNPFKNSPMEEGAVCFGSSWLVPFML